MVEATKTSTATTQLTLSMKPPRRQKKLLSLPSLPRPSPPSLSLLLSAYYMDRVRRSDAFGLQNVHREGADMGRFTGL